MDIRNGTLVIKERDEEERLVEEEPRMQIGEEKPRRSNRRRRRLEIGISDDEGFEQMSDEEFRLSDEDKKPKKKKKKGNNNNKKKKKKQQQQQNVVAPRVEVVEGNDPTPDLPEDFKARIREMNGTHLILVLQKRLFKTDIEKDESRLSIPLNQIKREFLTEEEKVRVVQGMQVMLIQPSLEESTINFKKWKMNKNSHLYVFTSQWNSVVQKNSLKTGTLVQVWSFRVRSELRFTLVKVREDGGDNALRDDEFREDGGDNGLRDDEF